MTDNVVGQLIDRSTLIHIQLNPAPRNSTYRQYRKTAFETDRLASECHVICLNWAGSVVQHGEAGEPITWPVVAGSAWYCPELSCSHEDNLVIPNHELGLYYTYLVNLHRHALMFHYGEAVFDLRVPKVATTGKAVQANRNGPSVTERYIWEPAASNWVPATRPADSGFNALIQANANAHGAMSHALNSATALDIERLLALSAGAVQSTDRWFAAAEIDSCLIKEDEIVRRITFAQDDNAEAADFRHHRLQVVAEIRHELDNRMQWPPQIDGVNRNSLIEWNPGDRHFNIQCADGRPALVSYLGQSPSPRLLENACDNLIHLLWRAGGPHQLRLCVIYREFGELKFAPLEGLTRFDEALDDRTDIFAVGEGSYGGDDGEH
jgi:hypothetical protein